MHTTSRRVANLLGAALGVVLLAADPAGASAQSKPASVQRPHSGFGLFSRFFVFWRANRVQCFIDVLGNLCAGSDAALAGAYWPINTANAYGYNSGLMVAGIIDSNSAGNSWAGDVEGAFFFNERGGGNGEQITEIYSAEDPADLAAWPSEAYVPSPPELSAALYANELQGRKTASDGDIWFLNWEGNPDFRSGRTHPLGLMVETRGLAYTAPGKEDLLFFVFTLYNISASNPAVYDGAPARLQARLRELGSRFQQLNEAAGATLPDDGYTIKDMYLALGADFDVTSEDAGNNFAGVNVPSGLGFTYHPAFAAYPSWSFDDPSIYSPPFFAGAGFVGIKYLKTPEVDGRQAGLTLFTNTTTGGTSAPRNTQQLYRALKAQPDTALGDAVCFGSGDPAITRICYIHVGAGLDVKFYQATGPMTLAPGEYQSIAVAYVFAAPVATGLCTGPAACGYLRPDAPTGDLTRFTNPALLPLGANTVDSIAGFRGWRDTTFTRRVAIGDSTVLPNGEIDQEELVLVPGSLLGKARTAQVMFDLGFFGPAAPAAPDFFLIPGDGQVTVIWRPSSTEAQGDPYFAVAQSPATYDPNFRQFDVAGYRIYRGTSDDPASLRLLAQFDVQGDFWYDRTGQINQLTQGGVTRCAPTLGIYLSCTSAGLVNGVATVMPLPVSLDGFLTQWETVLPTGAGIDTVLTVDSTVSPPDTTVTYVPVNLRAYATRVDTAVTGGGSGRPGLAGSGVPFYFVDRTGRCDACGVQNHRTYYYLVAAFDINSIRSGPSSLESSLAGAKSVVAGPSPVNVSSTGAVNPLQVIGRHGPLTDSVVPTIDPVTGRFSKLFPPADGGVAALAAFLPEVLPAAGGVTVTLDSLTLGQATTPGLGETPITYYWTARSDPLVERFTTLLAQDATNQVRTASAVYAAVPLDNTTGAKYGGSDQFSLLGSLTQTLVGDYYTSAYGRGCVNGAAGFVPGTGQAGCDYNGPRWFMGPSPQNNETKADPIFGNAQNFTAPFQVDRTVPNNGGWNNAGELANVQVIHQPYSYQTMGNQWRAVEAILGGAKRAADYNVYWNVTTAGKVDSVIDVTHDVTVAGPSSSGDNSGPLPVTVYRPAGATWGILNQQAAQPSGVGVSFDQRPELTLTDFGCVEPFRTLPGGELVVPCGAPGTPGDGPVYLLDSIAVLGPIAQFDSAPAMARTSTFTGQGFAMYLAGNLFMFQTTTLPQGEVWSLRDYVGAITGGNGFGGNDGPYAFYPVTRPFAAVGASIHLGFTASTTIANARDRDLRGVHTVPDPYYGRSALEASTAERVIKFVNLPERAIIRIYTVSGILVTVLEHNNPISSEVTWDLRSRNGRLVASGVYFWHVEALNARRVGRLTIVNADRR